MGNVMCGLHFVALLSHFFNLWLVGNHNFSTKPGWEHSSVRLIGRLLKSLLLKMKRTWCCEENNEVFWIHCESNAACWMVTAMNLVCLSPGYWSSIIDSIASWDWYLKCWMIYSTSKVISYFLDFHKPYYIININSISKPSTINDLLVSNVQKSCTTEKCILAIY